MSDQTFSETAPEPLRLIAVDIGNTAMKFGLFDEPSLSAVNEVPVPGGRKFPYPFSLTDCLESGVETDVEAGGGFSTLKNWLGALLRREGGFPGRAGGERFRWAIASVNHHRTAILRDWLAENRPNDRVTLLTNADVPLQSDYARPAALGIDRLLAALAAKEFFQTDGPAMIVDIGTAAKIDLLENGRFAGGAILPGPTVEARSLSERTDKLPAIDFYKKGEPFFYPATATEPAIRLGILGGIRGAILYFYRETLRRTGADFIPVMVTGGGAPGIESKIEPLLAEELKTKTPRKIVRTTRDAVLTGIALSVIFRR